MKLIDDWKKLHKMWSVQAAAAAATVQTTWLTLPDFVKGHLPAVSETVVSYMVAVLLVLVPILRAVSQTPAEPTEGKSDAAQ